MSKRRPRGSPVQKAECLVGSTLVQIIGDQNHVSINYGGKPLLCLVHPLYKVRQAQTLAIPTLRLLNTFMKESTFVGRADLIQNFIGWLESTPAFSIRTIIGPTGAGKTRFALELMEAHPCRSIRSWSQAPNRGLGGWIH